MEHLEPNLFNKKWIIQLIKYFSIISYFLLITCDANPSKTATIGEAAITAAAKASKNGEWLKAAQLYEQLYLQALDKEEWNYQAGTNYLRANKPNKALDILNNFDKKYQVADHDFNGRIARIAKAYYKMGNFKKVETVVENYSYPKMYRGLAREHLKSLIQTSKTEDLAISFAKYKQIGIYDDKGKKTNSGFLFRAICNELLMVGNTNLLAKYAEEYAQWVEQQRPADKRNLAIAHFYQQNYPQAIASLKEAIEVEDSPKHLMDLAGLLGVSYAKNKEFEKANTQIQQIQSMKTLPTRHDAFGAKWYHQARIELALNQKEKAINSLKKAVAAKAAFWSNRFKEDGLMKDLFGDTEFERLVEVQ